MKNKKNVRNVIVQTSLEFQVISVIKSKLAGQRYPLLKCKDMYVVSVGSQRNGLKKGIFRF